MSTCLNCGCMEEHSDKCVIYTGPDFPLVNLKYGERYDAVTVDLANKLVEIISQRADLQCLISDTCNTCSPLVPIPEAVQVIINKLCTLTSADIAYTGSMYCIGGQSTSSDAVKLLGRGYQFYVEPAETGTSVGFDLTSAVANLPSGYSIGKVKTIVSGRPKNGSTVIADSSQTAAAVRVENDRFPVALDVQIRLSSPNGSIDMTHTQVIPSASSQSAGVPLMVRDYAQGQALTTQESFNSLIAAQVCATKTAVEQMHNIQISGCDKISYPNTDVKAIVAVQSSELCDLITRVDSLEKVSYRECSDTCEDNLIDISLQEAIRRQADIICQLQTKIKELEQKVVVLTGKVQVCCDKS